MFARPERLRVVAAGEGLVSGTVTDVVFVGSTTHIRVAVADRELQIVVANDGDTRVPVPGIDRRGSTSPPTRYGSCRADQQRLRRVTLVVASSRTRRGEG